MPISTQVTSRAPEESVMLQFDRVWDWTKAHALLDLVEYERQQGIPATCLNRMDQIGNQMESAELERLSRMYPTGGGIHDRCRIISIESRLTCLLD
jgi:hypothetical protein